MFLHKTTKTNIMEYSPLYPKLDLTEIGLLAAKISHSNNDAEKLRVDSFSLLYHKILICQ